MITLRYFQFNDQLKIKKNLISSYVFSLEYKFLTKQKQGQIVKNLVRGNEIYFCIKLCSHGLLNSSNFILVIKINLNVFSFSYIIPKFGFSCTMYMQIACLVIFYTQGSFFLNQNLEKRDLAIVTFFRKNNDFFYLLLFQQYAYVHFTSKYQLLSKQQ